LARCLIIGCGCRGRALAGQLVARGFSVRGTTRIEAFRARIEAAGAEVVVGDPDRVGTLSRALEHVSVACILLGSAVGPREQIVALHTSRLEMLLQRMLDTTIRGVVYEAAGSVDDRILRDGAEVVRRACEGSRIPFAFLQADPAEVDAWIEAAATAVERILH
jgi:uncharacterized protein YbjT (DUF2867 family)